jgi:hypothetical protein
VSRLRVLIGDVELHVGWADGVAPNPFQVADVMFGPFNLRPDTGQPVHEVSPAVSVGG